jgi:hypothetical protein
LESSDGEARGNWHCAHFDVKGAVNHQDYGKVAQLM